MIAPFADFLLNIVRKFTQFAYRYSILYPLAQFTRKIFTSHLKEFTINDFDGTLFFKCDIQTYIASEIFWRGYYSYHQLKFLDSVLKPDMVFMDVGGNEGEFTCFAAKRLTSGLVISFEPVNFLFNKLKQNVELNQFKNVILVQQGLSDQVGKLPIYTSITEKKLNCENHGLPTLYPSESFSIKLGDIELTSLDDWMKQNSHIQRLDVIKIDIEGSELKALKGATQTLLKFRPLVLLEVNRKTIKTGGYTPQELINYLENLGYHYQLIYRHDYCTQGGELISISEQELSEINDLVFYPV